MKYKSLSSIYLIAALLMPAISIFAYEPGSIHGPKFIAKRTTTDILKGKLDTAVLLIENKGVKSFSEISKMNIGLKGNFGIFVIDPLSGQLLVSPPKESLGKYPLISKDLNGKVLAREIIKSEVLRKNESFIETLEHAYGLVYKNYFPKLAITPEGKLYVVAIGRNSAEMQKLFIKKTVVVACSVMQEMGVDKAIEIFNKEDGPFRFEDTYVFVYRYDKDNRGLLLCNPNYPQYVGTNRLKIKSKFLAVDEEAFKLIDEKGKGWLMDTVKNPVSGKQQLKDVYIQKVTVNGKSYIVGSGVYVSSKAEK
jgi:hypothetical protein